MARSAARYRYKTLTNGDAARDRDIRRSFLVRTRAADGEALQAIQRTRPLLPPKRIDPMHDTDTTDSDSEALHIVDLHAANDSCDHEPSYESHDTAPPRLRLVPTEDDRVREDVARFDAISAARPLRPPHYVRAVA